MQFLAMFIKILKICIELALIIIFMVSRRKTITLYSCWEALNICHVHQFSLTSSPRSCKTYFHWKSDWTSIVTDVIPQLNISDLFTEYITVFLASWLVLKIPGSKCKMYSYVIKGNWSYKFWVDYDEKVIIMRNWFF